MYMYIRGRDSMSKVGGLGIHKVGGYLTFILNISGIGYYVLHDNLQFWGAQPPLIKKWGARAPSAPPGSLPL